MSVLDFSQLPPPDNRKDFKKLCYDLWSRMWDDPAAREGKGEELGVDIYGAPNQGRDWAGVRCLTGPRINKRVLTSALNSAKNFNPSLSSLTIATSAARDVRVQRAARELTQTQTAHGSFSIIVASWDDIVLSLSKYPELITRYYPDTGLAKSLSDLSFSLLQLEAFYRTFDLPEHLPAPTNWQVFEGLCLDLWRRIWNDPNAQKHGRAGQPQDGVDIFGRPNDKSEWHAVVCKLRSIRDRGLRRREIENEVYKANYFTPQLSSLTIATTGPRNSRIQEVVRDLSEMQIRRGSFSVTIVFWDDIVSELKHHPDLVALHFPLSGLADAMRSGRQVIFRDFPVPGSSARGLGFGEIAAIKYYSCFISYSHRNKTFAQKLYGFLVRRGIECWLDEHHMLPGDDIYEQVDKGIRQWDKVLLCCSKASLMSWWVGDEIDKALEKERQLLRDRGERVLAIIPLNLDGYIFEWQDGRAATLRKRLAADFTGWEHDNAKFEEQFEQVVKALRTEGARKKPPEPKL